MSRSHRWLPVWFAGLLLDGSCLTDDWCANKRCADHQVCNPTTAVCECVDALCPDGYGCRDDAQRCEDYCIRNKECQEGFVCDGGDCILPCDHARPCPGGFACKEFSPGKCEDYCIVERDCRPEYDCDYYGECVP